MNRFYSPTDTYTDDFVCHIVLQQPALNGHICRRHSGVLRRILHFAVRGSQKFYVQLQ